MLFFIQVIALSELEDSSEIQNVLGNRVEIVTTSGVLPRTERTASPEQVEGRIADVDLTDPVAHSISRAVRANGMFSQGLHANQAVAKLP